MNLQRVHVRSVFLQLVGWLGVMSALLFPLGLLAAELPPALSGKFGGKSVTFPNSLAFDPETNQVYVLDNVNLKRFASDGSLLSRQPSYARDSFHAAPSVSINSGYLYLTGSDEHCISRSSITGVDATLSFDEFLGACGESGSVPGKFNNPADIAESADGSIYVLDAGNQRIQKFSHEGEYLSQWGQGGANDGEFADPHSIAIDAGGNVYVADTKNNRIQKFSGNGVFLSQWGTTGSGEGQFHSPKGIVIHASTLYVADTGNNRIQAFHTTGSFLRQWGSAGHADGQFSDPTDITTDVEGNLYVADRSNHRVQKFNADGVFIGMLTTSKTDGNITWLEAMEVAADGSLYVADSVNGRIQQFSPDGKFMSAWGEKGTDDAQFQQIDDIAIAADGTFYVSDQWDQSVKKFDKNGNFLVKWGGHGDENGQFSWIGGITVDPDGNVYVVDSGLHRIQKFSPNGIFLSKWGSRGSGNGQFSTPLSIVADNKGYIYVADTYNRRIQKFTSTGKFVSSFGKGLFAFPYQLGADNADNIYVLDAWWFRVVKFTDTGRLSSKFGQNFLIKPNSLAVRGDVIFVGDLNDTIYRFGYTPKSPDNLQATPLNSSTVSLKWTDNSANETGFSLERCQENGSACQPVQIKTIAAKSGVGNTISVSDPVTPTSQATVYAYRIRAFTKVGTKIYYSNYSNTVSVTVPAILSKPTSFTFYLTGSAQSKKVYFNWVDSNSDETGFKVERCIAQTSSDCTTFSQVATVAPQPEDPNRLFRFVLTQKTTAGMTYMYRVRSYRGKENSDYSDIRSFSVQ